jgi:hypothetical protein
MIMISFINAPLGLSNDIYIEGLTNFHSYSIMQTQGALPNSQE